ncbi:MAG: (deoxy)nucleoside triphosphate pyrophosphohydrolase [Candidatus Thermoplasmatota archaeon]|nr:(deoxy)nucleoside triphosphate pyrophosphohydrolase [Candidatus Thermoplasmatota archaeon]
MEEESMVVTGGIIPRNGRVLVAKRHMTSRFEPGKWEFPGGKLRFGEGPEECLSRELKEELGIEAVISSLFSAGSHVYTDRKGRRHVVLLYYICRIGSGDPECLDCAEILWADRDILDTLDFVEGDADVLDRLLKDEGFWSMRGTA